MQRSLVKLLTCASAALWLGACAHKPPHAPPPAAAPQAQPAPPPPPAKPTLQSEDSMRSTANGVDLALHRRVLVPQPQGVPRHVVLLLHPIGIPSSAAFDVKGYSLMDYLANRGYDVWAVDYRGFGRSSGAPVRLGHGAMLPTPRLEDSLADVKEAIDTILAGTSTNALDVIGYGYGGVLAAQVAEKYPSKVSRLVLYGTACGFHVGLEGRRLRLRPIERRPGVVDPKLPPYRNVDWADSTGKEWETMRRGKPLADPAAIEAVAAAFYASDYDNPDPPKGKRTLRMPTGPEVEMHGVWSNHAAFDPRRITVPTLIVRGDMDPLAEPHLVHRMKGTKVLREVVVKDATHWMLYEKGRDQILQETDRFLGGS